MQRYIYGEIVGLAGMAAHQLYGQNYQQKENRQSEQYISHIFSLNFISTETLT